MGFCLRVSIKGVRVWLLNHTIVPAFENTYLNNFRKIDYLHRMKFFIILVTFCLHSKSHIAYKYFAKF